MATRFSSPAVRTWPVTHRLSHHMPAIHSRAVAEVAQAAVGGLTAQFTSIFSLFFNSLLRLPRNSLLLNLCNEMFIFGRPRGRRFSARMAALNRASSSS